MPRGSIKRGLCRGVIALFCAAILPAAAGAETRSFVNGTELYPTGGAGGVGPANVFPSSIAVAGLSGTVTKAKVMLIGIESSSPDDIDMVLKAPNGQRVLLMSDVCGLHVSMLRSSLILDDAGPPMPTGGPCESATMAPVLWAPTNDTGATEPDDLSGVGGPAPPYAGALSTFNGASPNGAWNLYVLDDEAGYVGFDIAGWALTLDIAPPPPAPTPAQSGPTGQQAAALKKCKKKHGKARRKCRKAASLLPV